jgi:hypothetical protein
MVSRSNELFLSEIGDIPPYFKLKISLKKHIASKIQK